MSQFNDRLEVLQDFTNDRERLKGAIRRIRAQGATALHNALFSSLTAIAKRRMVDRELRRWAIVLLSDGTDTASLIWEEQILEVARRAELAVHTINLTLEPAQYTRHDPADRLLRVLADESGGQHHAARSISDVDLIYGRIREELRSLYTMGYAPPNTANPGLRRIDVRVPGRKDLVVRHRRSYYSLH